MNTLDQLAPRPAVNPPRDLALLGRVLSSALALLDGSCSTVSQPAELEFSDDDRRGQVAAFTAWRNEIWANRNAQRRAEWRARYGGVEAQGPTIGVVITPKAARFEGRGFRLKQDQQAEETAQLRLVPKGKRG